MELRYFFAQNDMQVFTSSEQPKKKTYHCVDGAIPADHGCFVQMAHVLKDDAQSGMNEFKDRIQSQEYVVLSHPTNVELTNMKKKSKAFSLTGQLWGSF